MGQLIFTYCGKAVMRSFDEHLKVVLDGYSNQVGKRIMSEDD